MKNIWTEKDITPGLIIIRDDIPKVFNKASIKDHAKECIYQIGFIDGLNNQPTLINLTFDGMVKVFESNDSLANFLNLHFQGFRPISKSQFLEIVSYNKSQLFYQ